MFRVPGYLLFSERLWNYRNWMQPEASPVQPCILQVARDLRSTFAHRAIT